MSEENSLQNSIEETESTTSATVSEISQNETAITTITIKEEITKIIKSPKKEIEKREKYHRESAEVAKKKIKLDINPDTPDGNRMSYSNYDNENLCEQISCTSKFCCLELNQNCYQKVKYDNPEYFHVTRGEHICNHCLEDLIRFGRPMFERYVEWKKTWINLSRLTPNVRVFVTDQVLPFYANCSKCNKFRKMSSELTTMTSEFLLNYVCNNCDEIEDDSIIDAKNIEFIQSLFAFPLLHDNPAVHYLRGEYFLDEVGFSPINDKLFIDDVKTKNFMSPFTVPTEQSVAFCVRPDIMEYDELYAFPEYANEKVPYLAMRNTIIVLWNLNPFERLTYDTCLRHLICRGLIRIWYATQLEKVFDYLEMKGVINYGLIPYPEKPLFNRIINDENKKQLEVIVVGGGISGLTVARQLKSFGAKVTVLEAKQRIGGRMQDDHSLGVAVGCGAQLITGIVNNPIVLMCEQANVVYRSLGDECPLIDSCIGRLVNSAADRLTDEHFNSILDAIGQWKTVTRTGDVSLMNQIQSVHEKLLSAVDFRWTKEHDRLFQWQIGNVEFSCGSRLNDVSARHWDQNEAIGQFAGAHALLADGSSELMKKLSEGLDIRCSSPVSTIDYSKDKIIIKCDNGKKYYADKVVSSIPLEAYHRAIINFIPELPEEKSIALRNLGAGLIEKVAVKFPRKFWSELLKSDGTLDYFGNVPKSSEDRGLFNMFYDFSTRNSNAKNQQYVLMSYVCGDSVNIVNTKSDVEVVQAFCDALQELFPEENIPKPIGYVVTHWGRDMYIGMSYSYLKVGGTGEHYDMLASSIDDKLYFCGEATNRFFPQTMTGSYISGLREAGLIAESYLNPKKNAQNITNGQEAQNGHA